jgi:DNA-binding NarL/FixJ family response regulator
VPGADAYIPGSALIDAPPAELALLAEEPLRTRIAKALPALGLRIEIFDSAEALADRDEELAAPAVIVMSDEQSVSSLAKLLEPLRRRFAEAAIVVVCEAVQRWDVRAALAAGAAGVVLRDDIEHALAACVQAVASGQTCVPRKYSAQVEPPTLSAREKQILGLVVMGCMNSEIADRLFLAESTVKSHLSSAFGKLGVRSRNEAVSLILDPEGGLGLGILGLGGEPIQAIAVGR